MEVLKAFCLVSLLIVIGVCFEWLFHPKADLSKCVYLLKADLCKVVKALITKEESRWLIDDNLKNKMKRVIEPYAATGMDIDVEQTYHAEMPCMCGQFVPDKRLDMQDFQRVTDLLKISFRRYLYINNKFWRNFACYESGPEYVRIYLYYEELEKDKKHFEQRYSILVKEKAGLDFGCLRDEDLDRQLGNV